MSPATFVASPRQTGSMPVASGSRLPTWPALSAPSARRVRCSAAFEERPSGLSSSRIPLICSAGCFIVRRRRAGAALADRLIDEARQARGAVQGVIKHEREPRSVPKAQAAAELPTQKAARVSEPSGDLGRIVTRCKRDEEDARRAQIRRQLDRRDRHVANARILHLAADEL